MNSVIAFGRMQEAVASDPALTGLGSGFLVGTTVFSLAVMLLLWYFVSRRASNIARWILVVFTLLGLLFLPGSLGLFGTLATILTLAITALQLAAIYYLFQPDAKAFFAGGARNSR